MAASAQNVIAGVGGLNGGAGVAWFAPVGTALPNSPLTALNVAFKDAGFITVAGIVEAVQETTTDIPAFGIVVPLRTVTTQSKRTFKVAFLETNPVTLAVYNRQPLSSIPAPTGTGIMEVQLGPVLSTQYSAVFDIVDGLNHVRWVCPIVQTTVITDLSAAAGAAIERPVEMTAFPDSTGYAVYEYSLVSALS